MRRALRTILRILGLEKLLILFTTGVVGFAVLLVAVVSVSRVERFARQQAVARVELAAAAAVQSVGLAADEVLTTGRLLAERPTLRRLVDTQDAASLVPFLDRFRETSRITGCAVLRDDALFASAGGEFPWRDILVGQGTHLGRFAISTGTDGALTLGASVAVPGPTGVIVLVARPLDESFLRETSEHAGLPVVVLGREAALRSAEEPGFAHRRHVVEWEDGTTGEDPNDGVLRAALPLRDPAGDVVGIVESSLSPNEMAANVGRFRRTLALVTMGVTALGGFASVLLARRLVRPVERLRQASERIGRGDLSTPIPLPAGREVGALATTMEEMRSKLLRLTAELHRRRAEADAILTGIAEGVFSVDSDRRLRYLNPQAAALLGIRADEAIGSFCGDVLRPQAEGGVRPCETECPIVHARFRGSVTATEHLVGRDGTRRTVVITSAAPAMDEQENGNDAADQGRQFQVVRDETDVESSRRLRDAVLANISHEFRTPLAAQLASIELLRDRLPELEPDEVHKLLLSIERGTARLTQLIDNLLESVRIEAGEDSIRRQPVALDEIVEEAVELAGPLFALRNQRVEVDLPYPVPPVSGDPTRLVQVLVNLLGNANKFSPPGTTVTVGGAVGADAVTLWIEDEGPGIPEQEAEAIFERFTRSMGEEPVESGMGLGLWIVKSIVERHGGHVAALARESGGTRLCVTLPTSGVT